MSNVVKIPSKLMACLDAAPQEPWTEDAFEQLRNMKFPVDEYDGDTGVLQLDELQAAELNRFFAAFGLKLPAIPNAVLTSELFLELQTKYARPVTVTLRGQDPYRWRDASEITDELVEYGKAVAARDLVTAARIAKAIFAPQGFGAFCI